VEGPISSRKHHTAKRASTRSPILRKAVKAPKDAASPAFYPLREVNTDKSGHIILRQNHKKPLLLWSTEIGDIRKRKAGRADPKRTQVIKGHVTKELAECLEGVKRDKHRKTQGD